MDSCKYYRPGDSYSVTRGKWRLDFDTFGDVADDNTLTYYASLYCTDEALCEEYDYDTGWGVPYESGFSTLAPPHTPREKLREAALQLFKDLGDKYDKRIMEAWTWWDYG